MVRVIEAPSARAQAGRLAGRLAARLATQMRAKRRVSLAVSGGDTPGPLFDALARTRLAWARVDVTLTDERWLPARDPRSNAHLARTRLLRAQAHRARFVALKTNHSKPERGIGLATARLAPLLPLDIAIIGMGADGHIASLFPGENLNGRSAVITAHAPGARGAAARMSLSLRTLLEARLVVLILRGRSKRDALAVHLKEDAPLTPVRALLARRRGETWISWAP